MGYGSSGNLNDTNGDYIRAAREIAGETNTTLIDMEAKTLKLVIGVIREKSKSLFCFSL
jgi:hypothetical protein